MTHWHVLMIFGIGRFVPDVIGLSRMESREAARAELLGMLDRVLPMVPDIPEEREALIEATRLLRQRPDEDRIVMLGASLGVMPCQAGTEAGCSLTLRNEVSRTVLEETLGAVRRDDAPSCLCVIHVARRTGPVDVSALLSAAAYFLP